MLGVFYTPGWAAVFAVGGTLAGVVVTQGVNAWNRYIDAKSKRADRQHERALEYEKRAWQAKSEALARLISACRFVKFRARLTGAENTDENDRRAATIRALDLFKGRVGDEDGISEVYAYAAEPFARHSRKCWNRLTCNGISTWTNYRDSDVLARNWTNWTR